MSKASEWAALDTQMRHQIDDRNEARASSHGVILTHFSEAHNVSEQLVYTPAQALALAHWILATFGDEPAP